MPPRSNPRKRGFEEIPSAASVEVVSLVRGTDGRLVKKRVIEKLRFDPTPPPPIPLVDSESHNVDIDDPSPPTKGSKRPSKPVSLRLEEWLAYRQEFLDELIRLEARIQSDVNVSCSVCRKDGMFRCRDCFGAKLMCGDCVVACHVGHPLHSLQKWNGNFFESATLTELGNIVQFGHPPGDPCSNPSGRHDLMVFDLNGVHRVVIQYCHCTASGGVSRRLQLLRARWFPATVIRPSTAFTFQLLDFFHKLQDNNKCNPYDFYYTILQRTDNAGLDREIFRYNEITLVLRIWSHLKQLKRGGAGHQPGGVDNMSDGSLAVECAACPHPGRNTKPLSPRNVWKNTLFLGVDACFKLKLKDRGLKDPDLGVRLAYMANDTEYSDYIRVHGTKTHPQETSSCGSVLHAVNQAYTKNSKGYSVTGVAAVSCRHSLVRPTGVVDLQKGEKYINVDYALASTLARDLKAGIADIVVTYDIGCRWGLGIRARLEENPAMKGTSLTSLKSWQVAVPKLHLVGHGKRCQATYNLTYMPRVGMTHGEGVETIWSHSTSLATWSRENGPHARHATLDDHWMGWNWKKLVGLRQRLAKNLERAWTLSIVQRTVATTLTQTFDPKVVEFWQAMITAYRKDPLKEPNPFEDAKSSVTLSDLRAELAGEAAQATISPLRPHRISQSEFVALALDIEDQQRKLQNMSSDEQTSLQEQRRLLLRSIDDLRHPQRLYMPGAIDLFDDIDPDSIPERPEDIKLWFPSELPPSSRNEFCVPGLPLLEFRFRRAQAVDALEELRRFLQLYKGLIVKKLSHLTSSQGTKSRSKTLFTGYNLKIQHAATRYRTARIALKRLDPNEQFAPWRTELRPLRKVDVCGPGQELNEPSESQYSPSWIWLTPSPTTSLATDPQEVHDTMRVEWCRAQARAKRFEEEVELVVEEMRRTIAFFKWKAEDWERQATLCPTHELSTDRDVAAGISAYARRQAKLYQQLAKACLDDWYEPLELKKLASAWLPKDERPPTLRQRRLVSNVHRYHTADNSTSGKDSPLGPGPVPTSELDLPRPEDHEGDGEPELAGALNNLFEMTAYG